MPTGEEQTDFTKERLEANRNNVDSTSGGNYVTAQGMEFTPIPPKGQYLVIFSGKGRTTVLGRPASFAISTSGGAGTVQGTEREIDLLEFNPFCCVALVTVDGTQPIRGVFKRDQGMGGVSAEVGERNLIAIAVPF